jgi:signal transduction histidine kinase
MNPADSMASTAATTSAATASLAAALPLVAAAWTAALAGTMLLLWLRRRRAQDAALAAALAIWAGLSAWIWAAGAGIAAPPASAPWPWRGVIALWWLLLLVTVALSFIDVLRQPGARSAGLEGDRERTVAALLLSVALAAGAWAAISAPAGACALAALALAVCAWIVTLLLQRYASASMALERMNAEFRRQLEHQAAAHHGALRQALDEAQAARSQAEQAALAKNRFLAAASHDLRQPVHAMHLYLARLSAAAPGAEAAQLCGRMQQSLAALDALHGPLLEVARLDADAVPARWQRVALAPLLQSLADEHAALAEARGLRLALRLAPALHGHASHTVTDPDLLARLLRNLLANAVKYTDQGGVLLACRWRSASRDLAQPTDAAPGLRIEVWDSGVGIAPQALERVFEEFEQPARERQGSARGGVGLGLAIARRLALLLQLRLVVASRPGRGSVFMLEGLAPAGGPSTHRTAT